MIELKNVSMIFNPGTVNENQAISNINLKVREGDFITVIGSNGAGKSTLFNLIAGTITPSSGSIFLNDRNITRDPEYKRAKYIGRIFQNPLLGTASTMSLEDNMMITYKKGFKWLKRSLNHKMREYFRTELVQLKMGLEDRMKENLALFSGGQRQALTLLMMVLSRPDLILLDEHTAALDPKNAQIVLELTDKFIREYNLTAMMITHNMSHAIEYGNRLLMMDKGEIIFEAEGEEKRALTVEKLIDKFHQIRHTSFENDRTLLSDD
ncbi:MULTISPECIES: ABC transporter ATP-binding protein [Geobacter]|uniref:ABC transporter ATP-binding protein n=1 Tax=Geobacter TaxID=28231 RepID=UPI0007AFE727|nr:ATP-binding cassette domain-containing protein [Geobacter sulfurreducens]ANA39164.1 ABC transporter ATP-binding protein [Geobacter anodireducens]BET60052.1 ATP-binding cassette domain-containing protein [Geobacter sp. 60473]BBA68762.1 Choline transport ATP-binding protein OpuBA [Geobacter sulfurreducens]HML77477.1 ATP-binding cassette domain-containing protein [Geobacter sulfurreducens]HMN01214.1 ATP-binding cassette domain-containing protein [Geobacter anodireducens]